MSEPKVDPRVAKRRQEVEQEAGRRRRRVMVVLGSGVAGVAGLIALTVSPALDVDHVEIRGAGQTSEAAVLEATELAADGHAMITVDRFALARRVERLPWVDSATVTRRWPNTVRITVIERVPIGVIGVPGGVALIDVTGRVLATASAPPQGTYAVTIAPGDVVPGPGRTVPKPVRHAITILGALSKNMREQVEVVRRLPGTSPTYELGIKGGVTVRLGDATRVDDKLAAAEAVLAAAHSPGTVIDVRVPRSPAVTRAVTSTPTSTSRPRTTSTTRKP